MTAPRRMHCVVTHRHPQDGRQFVMCVCPLGIDHAPAAIVIPTDDGMFWVRFTGDGPNLPSDLPPEGGGDG